MGRAELFSGGTGEKRYQPESGMYQALLDSVEEVEKPKYENGAPVMEFKDGEEVPVKTPAILFNFILDVDGEKKEFGRALNAFFKSDRATIYKWLNSMDKLGFETCLASNSFEDDIILMLGGLTGRNWQIEVVTAANNKDVNYIEKVLPLLGGGSTEVVGEQKPMKFIEEELSEAKSDDIQF